MLRNLLTVINSNNKKKPYSVNAKQIGVTRNAVAINPLTGYNVSTGNVMTQVANSSVSNAVTNGNFASTTGWCGNQGTFTVNNNEAIYTITGSLAGTNGVYTNCTTIVGNKYYLVGEIYPKYNSNFKVGVSGLSVTPFSTIVGIWNKGSMMFTATATSHPIVLYHSCDNGLYAVGDTFKFRRVIMIDLTAIFGKGFEPTQAWCDSNIPFFTGTLSNPSWVNPLVTHNQYGYVGGDTTELTFDFGTKVAGSVSECPIKSYWTYNSTLRLPSEITGYSMTGWQENTTQAQIDNLKTQEGTVFNTANSTNGVIAQQMLELDLTPVANQLFGGSNSALKSALKSSNAIIVDVWALGSGSNGGVATNGVDLRIWDGSAWATATSNSTSSIAKMTYTSTTQAFAQGKIDSSNKIYILVNATYPSNGTIASSISLDHVKITIGLNRTVDTVTTKSVVLPKYFACLIRGFSPSWDNTDASNRRIVEFYTDANNRVLFSYYLSGSFMIHNIINGINTNATSTGHTFEKYRSYNFLFIRNSTSLKVYLLKNNGSMVQVYSTDSTNFLKGNVQFRNLMAIDNGGTLQASSFVESIQIYDLQSLYKVKKSIKNLLNVPGGVTWNSTVDTTVTSITGGIRLTNSVSGTYKQTYCVVTGLKPNTQYTVKANGVTVTSGISLISVRDINDTLIGATETSSSATFTSPSNGQVRIKFYCTNSTAAIGSVDYTNIQLEEGGVATTYDPYYTDLLSDYEAESILRSDSKYYVTTTSDYVGKVSGSVVENSNISKLAFSSSLVVPSGFSTELQQSYYDKIKTLNADSFSYTVSSNTNMAQQIFSFNLIEIIERKYGPIPNCSTTAEKVAWIKAGNVKTVTGKWYGYGSNPSGNGANFEFYTNSSAWSLDNTWHRNTASSPTLITTGSSIDTNGGSILVDSNGFVHFIAYTSASNGTVASTIYTDYISLDVTVKTGNTSVYVPQKELFDINAVTLHPNATRSNGVITLNANGGLQESYIDINVLPNNKYCVTSTLTESSSYAYIQPCEYYNSIYSGNTSSDVRITRSSVEFTTKPNTNRVRLKIGSTVSGTFTFSNISCKLKM